MWDGFLDTTWEVLETFWASTGFQLAAIAALPIALALIGAFLRIAVSILRINWLGVEKDKFPGTGQEFF